MHRRSVVKCSFICMQEDELKRSNKLPLVVRTLLKNMQKVDEWACLEPVEEGDGKKIWEVSVVPFDHTNLGTHMVHSGGTKSFELKNQRRAESKMTIILRTL